MSISASNLWEDKLTLFEVRDLRFGYAEGFHLEIEHFRLDEGEKVAVVGQNGSGKTTFLRILGFLEKPSAWKSFRYRGVEFAPGRVNRDSIGVLRQQPWVFRGTVASNLAFSLKARRRPASEIASRIEATCTRLGLTGYRHSPARKLSGGEQKRVALGRVLIAEPEILLLDEPMAHLDRSSQEIIGNLILETDATVLFTTHELRTALKLADRTVNMKDGRIAPGLPVNIFEGRSSGNRLTTRRGLEIHLPESVPGPVAKCVVDPSAIAISLKPFPSSIRNSFPGKIRSIQAHGENVWIEIDGTETFTAVISRTSYEQMGLNLHKEIVVLFKAAAVQVL